MPLRIARERVPTKLTWSLARSDALKQARSVCLRAFQPAMSDSTSSSSKSRRFGFCVIFAG
jgi:hypothetical protein